MSAGSRQRPGGRLETWLWTGPLGHLLGGAADLAAALCGYGFRRARRALRRGRRRLRAGRARRVSRPGRWASASADPAPRFSLRW